jgi:hypothetical protein
MPTAFITALPGVLALLVLVGLLVRLAVAAHGRPRTLGLVGITLVGLGLLASIALGAAAPALVSTFHLSVTAVVLLLNGTSLLLSTAGVALLAAAVVTATRTAPAR